MECENCGAKITKQNIKRHVKACKRNKSRLGRKIGICEECNQEFKQIDKHIKRGCTGKIKRKIEEVECRNCKRMIEKGNIKQHYEKCKKGHIINRWKRQQK
jgi:hypothetical protein